MSIHGSTLAKNSTVWLFSSFTWFLQKYSLHSVLFCFTRQCVWGLVVSGTWCAAVRGEQHHSLYWGSHSLRIVHRDWLLCCGVWWECSSLTCFQERAKKIFTCHTLDSHNRLPATITNSEKVHKVWLYAHFIQQLTSYQLLNSTTLGSCWPRGTRGVVSSSFSRSQRYVSSD